MFADELDIHLLPKVGCAWMPKGTQVEVMTPGQHQKHYLAGALDLGTGTLHHCLGPRKTNALFRDLLTLLDARYPADRYTWRYVVVDNYIIHKAKPVEQWLAAHLRLTLLFLPTYCSRANPIERAFGEVHDCCTRNHQRNRLPDLVADVEDHVHLNGPWPYKLSDLYNEPRSPRPSSKSPPRNTHQLPPKCTNLVWTDLGGHLEPVFHLEFHGPCGTAPAGETPAIGWRGRLEQRPQAPLQPGPQDCRPYRRRQLAIWVDGEAYMSSLVEADHAVEAGTRAEQEGGHVGRMAASRTQ